MSNRVVIGTAATLEMGRVYEQMFREAGVPVTAMMTGSGVDLHTPGSSAELWLEDDGLLQDVEVRQVINDLLHREVPDEEMPGVEAEYPPTVAWPISWWLMVTFGIILGMPLVAYAVFLLVRAILP